MAETDARRRITLRDRKRDCRLVISTGNQQATVHTTSRQSERASQMIDLIL